MATAESGRRPSVRGSRLRRYLRKTSHISETYPPGGASVDRLHGPLEREVASNNADAAFCSHEGHEAGESNFGLNELCIPKPRAHGNVITQRGP